MEIDPLIIFGAFGTLILLMLKEMISLRAKLAESQVECERRLSRLEAIVNFYFLKVPVSGKDKQRDRKIISYLQDAEVEIFGKNLVRDARNESVHLRERNLNVKNINRANNVGK